MGEEVDEDQDTGPDLLADRMVRKVKDPNAKVRFSEVDADTTLQNNELRVVFGVRDLEVEDDVISGGIVEELEDVIGRRLSRWGAKVDNLGAGAALRLPGRVHHRSPAVVDRGDVVEEMLEAGGDLLVGGQRQQGVCHVRAERVARREEGEATGSHRGVKGQLILHGANA